MLRQPILLLWAGIILLPAAAFDAPQASGQTNVEQAAEPEEEGNPSDQQIGREALIAAVRPSIATIEVTGRDGDQLGVGTGFVIDPEGLIATNFHVIEEGRPLKVEMASGRKLPILGIEASDRTLDLAVIRVDVEGQPLTALPLSDSQTLPQGTEVIAFGNPLGLSNSVVAGIVSAAREINGRRLIQLAMPVQRGNSGGPVVDSYGKVIGIVNMKSAVDDNLGFAIPIADLTPLLEKPNPVTMDRWVRLRRIDQKKWTPLFGATWQDRGGIVSARGLGSGFGGRSLCLTTETPSDAPIEIAVKVRLDDEAGAAGLAFHSDGDHRHYGFYPSNGRLRLTCFKGPSVYSWQVLEELQSEHYLPNHWNHLRVRIEQGRLQCFVNGHLVIESTDRQLTSGGFGLVKFRDTNPDFKGFQFGADLPTRSIPEKTERLLEEILARPAKLGAIDGDQVQQLGESGEAVSRRIAKHLLELEEQAERLRRLAADVELAPTLRQLEELMSDASKSDIQLLLGVLLVAKLDNPDIDVDAYQQRIGEMADEIRDRLSKDADPAARRVAMHKYLFDENGFHGGRTEYYHPANSHMNRVIDDREGLPITLSILYMELGRRLGLQIEGVGLPGRFVVKHVTDEEQQLIDVFDRGKLLSREDAEVIVASYAGRIMTADDLRAQTVVEILTRVLNNLIGVASDQQDVAAMHRYYEGQVAVNPQAVDSRFKRSQIRAITGRTAGAVEDLNWLIERDPPGLDRQAAQQLRDAIIAQQQSLDE
jgi:serine protease Do